jgi:hypothetical protein
MCALLTMAAVKSLEKEQIDGKTACLNGPLEEIIYMDHLPLTTGSCLAVENSSLRADATKTAWQTQTSVAAQVATCLCWLGEQSAGNPSYFKLWLCQCETRSSWQAHGVPGRHPMCLPCTVLTKLMTTLRGAEGAEAQVIYQGNQGALALQRSPSSHRSAKHIDVAHHFVRAR